MYGKTKLKKLNAEAISNDITIVMVVLRFIPIKIPKAINTRLQMQLPTNKDNNNDV